jgi:hypothetical protein
MERPGWAPIAVNRILANRRAVHLEVRQLAQLSDRRATKSLLQYCRYTASYAMMCGAETFDRTHASALKGMPESGGSPSIIWVDKHPHVNARVDRCLHHSS